MSPPPSRSGRCTTRWTSGSSQPFYSARSAGLRFAEACGLRVADVDFMRGVIHPSVQYPVEPLKTEMSRTAIPIPQSMALMLASRLTRGSETVLTGADGGQLGPWALERAMRRARVQVAALPEGFRYHDLRHYFASLLIAFGADVKTVQARLRHASAKTTLDTYGHLWPDRDSPPAPRSRPCSPSEKPRPRVDYWRIADCLRTKAGFGTLESQARLGFSTQMSKYSSNSCGCGRSRIGSSSFVRL